MQKNIRIAVAEDDARVRRQIVKTLEGHPGWHVVAACANPQQALQEIPGTNPDLVLLDILLPRGSGIELIQPLRASVPEAQVVMLTVVEHARDIVRAIRAGASGYILKKDAANLVQDVETVLAGGAPVMSPSVARQLWALAQHSKAEAARKTSGLSPRESEILQLAARGKQQGEIALALGISVNTVKTHLRRIYEKLGTNSVLESLHKLRGTRDPFD